MNFDTFDKLLTMYVKQKANLEKYKAEVGATDDEIKAIKDGADNLQYLKDFAELVEASKRAVTQIKQQVFIGDKNSAIANFGGFPAFSPPHVPLAAGLKELALERNRRYKAAPGYTKAIGIELGIEEDSQSISPEQVKPDADYTPSASGYLVSVVVSNRGRADSWDVFIQYDGETTWTLAKTATGKSVDFTVTPKTPGKPERVKAKVQLKKQNENYGQPSDIDEFTANP
jgi:hypothetical protein